MFHRRAGRRPKAPRFFAAVATLGMLAAGGPVASADSSASPTPSINVSAPTPTAPYPTGPPQGFGPDGITIGGTGLNTRALAQAPGTPALPGGIDAKGWVVADATSGQILATQDPHGRYYPASTLKLLTMTTLYPLLDPNMILTATHEDASVEGSRVGIVENGQYTVAQLWNALVLQSGNDAAQMLAEGAGGLSKTLSLMNAKAKALQAYDTIAGTVSGLDVSGQSSSPYDLCIFLREIISNPATLKVAGELTGQLPPVPPKYGPVNYSTQDKLLSHQYPGVLGGKTGFTDAARHTFVGAAARDGRTLIVSLMQAEQTPVQTWQQAAALLDWGFSTPATASGLGKLVVPGEVSEQPAAESSSAGSPSAAISDAAGIPAAQTTPKAHGMPLWPAIPVLVLLVAGAIWIAAPVHSKSKKHKGHRH